MPTDPPIVFENSAHILATPGTALAAMEEELIEAAIGFAAASRPPNTQVAYDRQWPTFEAWCAGQGATALPAAPATVASYLTARTMDGRKVSTLFQAIAAIARTHRDAALDAPHKALIVERTWDGIRRTLGSAPRRVAPATVDVQRKTSAALPSSLLGARDRAVPVLGLGGAFRRSELAALDISDVYIQAYGLIVQARRSKTDQVAAGVSVGLRAGVNPMTCPVRTLRVWLEAAEMSEGALFRTVNRHGQLGARLAPAAIAQIVKRGAAAAGLDAGAYAGHSLRAGLATSAAATRKSDRRIMSQARWSSRAMVDRYVREATQLDDDNPTANIGL